jgi:hypothetical protein
MAAMEPMAAVYAAHAAPMAHATDVTPTETEATTTEATPTKAAAMTEATPTKAAAMTAATTAMTAATTAAATPGTHQHQQTVLCIQIGVVGIARLSERCRGSKGKRKSAADTKRDDAAFHDCTPCGHRMASSLHRRKQQGDIFDWRPFRHRGFS